MSHSPRHAPIPMSQFAARSRNPLRAFVEGMRPNPIPGMPLIPLSLGDPTVFGNFPLPPLFQEAVAAALASGCHNGYIHSAGDEAARASVAAYYNQEREADAARAPLEAEDIVIASGASGALDLAIGTLLDPGDELLVPCPGFPLYTTIAEARGIKLSPYKLRPDADWEADLEQVDLLLQQARARGVRSTLLINNPSNPCGTVFSREHVTALLAIAERHAVPVISDEIYARVVFKGVEFVSAADVAPNVPVLVVGGIAKEYMVPGWRVGWLALYGEAGVSRQNGSLAAIRKGLAAVSQLTLGANSLILSALPAILTPRAGPQADGLAAWRAATLRQLEDNAKFACEALENIPGVAVVRPSGSMYLLFSVPSSPDGTRGDDVLFAKTLLNDMAVFVLPGAAFGAPGFCRIVLTPPIEKLREAFARIATFCAR